MHAVNWNPGSLLFSDPLRVFLVDLSKIHATLREACIYLHGVLDRINSVASLTDAFEIHKIEGRQAHQVLSQSPRHCLIRSS
jgi:hypothetical protein